MNKQNIINITQIKSGSNGEIIISTLSGSNWSNFDTLVSASLLINTSSYAIYSETSTTASFALNAGGSAGLWTASLDGTHISRLSDVEITGSLNVVDDIIVDGVLYASEKHFYINHPTQEGKKLIYGSLEGPENGVYVRGMLKGSNIITLPDYWIKLVDLDTMTVSLTPIGKYQKLVVEKIENTSIFIKEDSKLFKSEIHCYYLVFAERKDIQKLKTEIV